ncbi:hypothetical protein Tco_0090014 [Tanacetum coccineum]
MSNSNTNLQTQSSNVLHNAIMEAGSKKGSSTNVLAPGNYVQWKSRIKRYIDTKPNSELNPTNCPAKIHHIRIWRTIRMFHKTYDQLNAEAEAVQIILTGINNESYSTVDALFVTLVKQSQELKTVSYYKLYDILKQHQNEVNEIRAERLARIANPLALVAQQQPVYHHKTNPTQNNSNIPHPDIAKSTRNRGKAIVTSSAPIYDQEPDTVTEDDEMSKEKEIDKLMALISSSLQTSGFSVITAKEYWAMYQWKLNAEQADWKDDTDDEPDDQELEAHYMYMTQIS